MAHEPMVFDLAFQEEEVRIKGTDGMQKKYTLRECTGAARDKYLTGVANRTRMEGGKAVGMKDWTGLQSSLLTLCLFDDAGKAVPEGEIQAWPARVQDALYEKAKELSAIGVEAEKEAKND